MIEVITFTRNGNLLDRAECDVEAAVMTARTLLDDVADTSPHATASFYTDGKLVRGSVPRIHLHEGSKP